MRLTAASMLPGDYLVATLLGVIFVLTANHGQDGSDGGSGDRRRC